MTMRDIYISLQMLSKIGLKTGNCKILPISFGCVLIVAMTFICLNLQSVSSLGHNVPIWALCMLLISKGY